jgi:ribonucleoside-diphosphate reductase alpha chain
MQGGTHRGANMGILNADHPDILEFITCKTQEGEISNFNISVGASDAFMEAVVKDRPWKLVNPRDGKPVMTVSARKLFEQMVQLAWKTGDPGMIFLDNLNKDNPLLKVKGPIESTNVCGEVPLYPFEPCNLGSINLAKFVSSTGSTSSKSSVSWERLEAVTRLVVRFLDNGVDASKFPLKQITQAARDNRRIGVGVMGWAEMLYQLRLPYDSEKAVKLARKVMGFIQKVSHEASGKLAREKGVFPNWKGSEFARQGKRMRNVAVTTIAPTGTISMVSDCSSGIEPVFALSYVKNVVDEAGLTYTNPYFEQALAQALSNGKRGKMGEVLGQVVEAGSVQGVAGVPTWIKDVFRVAYDIAPEWHVQMQAAFQEFTDNAVSKTINFPVNATVEDIEKAYILAWKSGCKGITAYRDQSKAVQILSTKQETGVKNKGIVIQSKIQLEPLSARAATANVQETGECPECGAKLTFSEGCVTCPQCAYSHCAV